MTKTFVPIRNAFSSLEAARALLRPAPCSRRQLTTKPSFCTTVNERVYTHFLAGTGTKTRLDSRFAMPLQALCVTMRGTAHVPGPGPRPALTRRCSHRESTSHPDESVRADESREVRVLDAAINCPNQTRSYERLRAERPERSSRIAGLQGYRRRDWADARADQSRDGARAN